MLDNIIYKKIEMLLIIQAVFLLSVKRQE